MEFGGLGFLGRSVGCWSQVAVWGLDEAKCPPFFVWSSGFPNDVLFWGAVFRLFSHHPLRGWCYDGNTDFFSDVIRGNIHCKREILLEGKSSSPTTKKSKPEDHFQLPDSFLLVKVKVSALFLGSQKTQSLFPYEYDLPGTALHPNHRQLCP